MSKPFIALKFYECDNGNARVYYRDTLRRLYCFQDNTPWSSFELLTCSRDGEPDSPMSHANVSLDKSPPSDGSIGDELTAWLIKEGLANYHE